MEFDPPDVSMLHRRDACASLDDWDAKTGPGMKHSQPRMPSSISAVPVFVVLSIKRMKLT